MADPLNATAIAEVAFTTDTIVSAPEVEANILAMDRIASNLLRALDDHRPAAHSYGIQVARLAGLPASVVQRAREVLLSLEGNGAVLASSARLPRQHSHEGEPSRSIPAAQPDAGAHALLIERLRAFDVLRMTPLQAMSELSALVDEARKA